MKTKPARSVPAIAPTAPAANIAPSALPAFPGRAMTATWASTGAGMPAKKDGGKKASIVSTAIEAIGCWNPPMTAAALQRRTKVAPAAVTAAPAIDHAVSASARFGSASAIRPPAQCPAENPASTTAMTEVHV